MKHRSVVVAFGGNALLRAGDRGTDREQERNADRACRLLVDLVRRKLDLVIVHGNGPQVGNILIQIEEAALKVPPSSLDVAVAYSQGSIGYILERSLRNQLRRAAIDREVCTLITQVRVEERPEALRPTKPVGPFFSPHRATELRKSAGWSMVEDSGRGWRKVVPSPRPVEVVNARAISDLLRAGHVVIAGGGGGIPVRRGPKGKVVGVEAVIDKDFTAALLGRQIGASLLIVLTSVPCVFLDFGQDSERPLGVVSASQLAEHLEAGHFPDGSMGPKVRGILDFLQTGGREVIVTDAQSVRAALRGKAGTRVFADRPR